MPATPEQHHDENLKHARWRVAFRRSLLAAHRLTPRVGTDWSTREQDFLLHLAHAQQDLRKLEAETAPSEQ